MVEDDSYLLIGLPGLTENENRGFSLVEAETFKRVQPTDRTKYQITYQHNLDAVKITRSIYTYFQALGDTGGLNSILVSITSVLVSVLSHNSAENFLVNRLYTSRDKGLGEQPKSANRSKLHQCCPCRRRKHRQDKFFKHARGLYADETDIVHILRKLRLVMAVARKLTSPEEI